MCGCVVVGVLRVGVLWVCSCRFVDELYVGVLLWVCCCGCVDVHVLHVVHPLVEFMYLVFTHKPAESYHR